VRAGLSDQLARGRSGGTVRRVPGKRAAVLEVIRMHRDSVDRVRRTHLPAALYEGARECWDDAYQSGKRHGYRNAQVTVIAPTGTIGFMMDCDTTGIEPDLRW